MKPLPSLMGMIDVRGGNEEKLTSFVEHCRIFAT